MFGLGSIENQINTFGRLADVGHQTLKIIKEQVNHPDYNRSVRQYNMSEVVRLTSISRNTIKSKEKNGAIQYDNHDMSISKDNSYTLSDIQKIREANKRGFFAGEIIRPTHLKPFKLAVCMFKGGVGKTTHSCHLAAYSAIQGLRTLLVDLDSQASSTLNFGFIPDLDLDSDASIYTALIEDPREIKGLIKKTHFHGLDIIPAGLSLADANVNLHQPALNNVSTLGSPLLRLSSCLSLIENDYDLIIFDCPPNHEAVALNALFAADSYLIPISPNMLSFGSANAFFRMLHEINSVRLQFQNTQMQNRFFRMLITNDPQNNESRPIGAAIRQIYSEFVMTNSMAQTIALNRASNDLGLLYDQNKSSIRGDKEAFSRALHYMDEVNKEIFASLKEIWHQESDQISKVTPVVSSKQIDELVEV